LQPNKKYYSIFENMHLKDRIAAFSALGQTLENLSTEELSELGTTAQQRNGWFTPKSVAQAIEGIKYMLSEENLKQWTEKYSLDEVTPKVVGIVMAGNIPLVGFHDLLSVLISGHFAAIKPSSDDAFLTQVLIDWIVEIEPRFKKNMEVRDKLTQIDAVIATGSDNTARYFEYYFKDIPNIIRKNRTSIAIIDGNEKEDEIKKLGDDIFSYYGLGCRNVSKVFTPKEFDLTSVFPSFDEYQSVIDHHKYRNNYDYYKSIYLVNKTPHLDTGYLLVSSTNELVSPISVLYHQEYDSIENLETILKDEEGKIQCIVGNQYIPFGKAQTPELWDYADNVDTLAFLSDLN